MKWITGVALGVLLALAAPTVAATMPANAPKTPIAVTGLPFWAVIPSMTPDAIERLVLFAEFIGKEIPTDAYLARQRQCETGDNPLNGGDFSGAYGMYRGTWKDWGGRQFAKEPFQATPIQQTVVWIRVTFTGWGDKPPAGPLTNSCWDHALPLEMVTYP